MVEIALTRSRTPGVAPIQQAAPFLKWAGGKSQLLEQYAPLLPAGPVAAYFEPFVGSGALFFALRGRDFARRYALSDVNPELINVYRVVRDELPALIALLEAHRAAHAADSRTHYYAVRDRDRDPGWPGSAPAVERAARMIYLNKTCYNGLWRVNSKGHFNVPLGRYTNPPILDEGRLRAASAALQGVDIAVRDFRDVAAAARPGDFVYFDPPYVPLNATSNFTSYARDAFGEPEQRALAEVFRQLSVRGCKVMLSNSSAPCVYELYADFHVMRVQARRAINSKAGKRGLIDEVVVVNYQP
jgi:DNA adenine methylase